MEKTRPQPIVRLEHRGDPRGIALDRREFADAGDAILSAHGDPDRRRSIAAAARTVAIAQDATFSAARFDDLYRTLQRP